MEVKKFIIDDPIEYDVIIDEEFDGIDQSQADNEPWDLEDRLYDEWRDEKKCLGVK